MANTFDVVVVGAGIVGTFHAYFLAQRGLKTLLVDRDPAPRQATVRNFGMIVTGTIAAPGVWDGFARRTNELYRQLDDETIIGDSHQYFPLSDPTGFDNHANVREAILTYDKGMVHLDDWTIGKSWAGYVMSHPDEDAVVGEVAPSVHVALGIAGKGMSTATGFAEANMARVLDVK